MFFCILWRYCFFLRRCLASFIIIPPFNMQSKTWPNGALFAEPYIFFRKIKAGVCTEQSANGSWSHSDSQDTPAVQQLILFVFAGTAGLRYGVVVPGLGRALCKHLFSCLEQHLLFRAPLNQRLFTLILYNIHRPKVNAFCFSCMVQNKRTFICVLRLL